MIKLCVPQVGKEEIQAIEEVINSKFLVQGNKVKEFEGMLEAFLGVKNAIAVSSGTAALHLALLASDIGPLDEVIVPDFTFPATANVVEAVGATTKLVDIDLNTFCIDASKIEEKITKKTKAIIPVHEFGNAASMDIIMELAKKYNLKVIEDAACALGAEFQGEKAGTIGHVGCFSLHPRKAITTGEGGVIVTNDDALADKIRSLRNHGIKIIDGKVQFVLPGLNYRMTDFQGAMAVAQMMKLKDINTKRREIAKLYSELLINEEKIIIPREGENCKHIWQTYHILLKDGINRDSVIEQLKRSGIEVNIGAYAVHEQIYYKNKYGYAEEEFKNAKYAYGQGIALPLYAGLSMEEVRTVINRVEMILNE